MPKLKVKYLKSDDYSPVYANGAVGGVNVKGEIVIHFYIETLELPKSQSFSIEGENVKNELINEKLPKDEPGTVSVQRQIKNGVIMTMTEAALVHQWLGNHLKALKPKTETDAGN